MNREARQARKTLNFQRSTLNPEPSTRNPQPGTRNPEPSSDVLVRVDGVSKKFCKSLKRSLWYGVKDTVGEMFGQTGGCELRTNEFWAVKDVSFELRRGECLGLIRLRPAGTTPGHVGHNSAGKNGLLKTNRLFTQSEILP